MRDFTYWRIPEHMEVARCPECGSENIVMYNPWGMWHAMCSECKYKTRAYNSPEMAVKAWNNEVEERNGRKI